MPSITIHRSTLAASLASLGLLAGSLALIAPGVAAAAPGVAPHVRTVTFSGKMTCTLNGAITAKPALTSKGGKPAVLTLSGSITKCTGSTKKSGVTITGGTVKATSKVANNSCTGLISKLPALSGTVSYTSKGGKATPTSVRYSAGSVTSTSPITVKYPGSGATSKSTGSFAGTKGSATAVVKQSVAALLSECGSSKGASALDLTSKSRAVLG